MALRHALIVLAAGASVALGGAVAASASTTGPATPAPGVPVDQCSSAYANGNALLGPDQLPIIGVIGSELIGYQPTGSLSESAFFTAYRDAAGWILPPDNGFRLDANGKPIEWSQTLEPGDAVDRYGSVSGSSFAPEGTPYSERAIPPSQLDASPATSCGYHAYVVVKPFAVEAGPVAAWYAQPGGALQYQLDGALLPGAPAQLDVRWLLEHGYLKGVTPAI